MAVAGAWSKQHLMLSRHSMVFGEGHWKLSFFTNAFVSLLKAILRTLDWPNVELTHTIKRIYLICLLIRRHEPNENKKSINELNIVHVMSSCLCSHWLMVYNTDVHVAEDMIVWPHTNHTYTHTASHNCIQFWCFNYRVQYAAVLFPLIRHCPHLSWLIRDILHLYFAAPTKSPWPAANFIIATAILMQIICSITVSITSASADPASINSINTNGNNKSGQFGPRTNCSMSEFTCTNTRCVPLNKYCDKVNDCGDSSDEPRFCTSKIYIYSYIASYAFFFVFLSLFLCFVCSFVIFSELWLL